MAAFSRRPSRRSPTGPARLHLSLFGDFQRVVDLDSAPTSAANFVGSTKTKPSFVSTIAVAEVVAGPLKAGNEILAAQYCEALRGSKNWETIPVTEEIAILAARIRAIRNLRLPDAIQVATAVATGSLALVTHDVDFSKVQEIKIIS